MACVLLSTHAFTDGTGDTTAEATPPTKVAPNTKPEPTFIAVDRANKDLIFPIVRI
jgi:hypothetical protein